jgi:hypothetical protein
LPVHPWSMTYWFDLHLKRLQVCCRRFAGSTIRNEIKRHFLSFVEIVHTGALYGANVHEYILAAVDRLNEAKALLAVEPLYGSLSHRVFFRFAHSALVYHLRSLRGSVQIEFWENH